MSPNVRRDESTARAARSRHPGRGAVRALGIAWCMVASMAASGCSSHLLGGGPRTPAAAERNAPRGNARDRAIAEARESAALQPSEPYWPFRVAVLAQQADSTAQADAELAAALARDPGYVPALAMASERDAQRGHHAEAARRLEAAAADTRRFPNGLPAPLRAALALHYDALDRPDLARAALGTLSRDDRDEAGIAAVYVGLRGDAPDSAAALAADMVRRHPKSAACQNNFGIARLRAGDPVAARKAFLEAIERDPKLPGPYYNLAILDKFFALDDAAAAKWFARYRERSTQDPDGLAQTFAPPAEPKPMAGKGE